jgi:hypothetical protein
MKTCDLCGLRELDGEWFAYNEEHNLVVCPICEQFANQENDNDKVWQFGDARRKHLAAAALGKLGGQAGKGKPKQRPEGYYSTIAKLPRKRKPANL